MIRCSDLHSSGMSYECCDSCHEDEEIGYGLVSLGATLDPPACDAEVCCAATIAFNKLGPDEQKKILFVSDKR